MSKQMAQIPLSQIDRVQIYLNTKRLDLKQIKAATGADYIINGGLYEGNKAVCHLKADGYVYAKDPYTYWGYAWDDGPDISMCVVPAESKRNYICCTDLIRQKIPNPKPIYTKAQGGVRGRTAMGIKDGSLCLYVSSDGSADTKTPEQLRDELAALGWQDAIMLDSGGSSQCDFAGKKITSTRAVHNLILVYLKKEGVKPPVSTKKIVCLDPGHGPGSPKGSPDGIYKEEEFDMDMANRVAAILAKNGLDVVLTRDAKGYPSLTQRANISNKAKADLFVSLHSNAAGSGWNNARGCEVYTSSPGSSAGRNIAAGKILDRLKTAGVLMRPSPLRHEGFTVLTVTKAPAALIEYGFHDNKEDVALLESSAYRDKLAVATAQGICDYLGVSFKPQATNPDREAVQKRFGLDNDTMNYLEQYKYGADLLRKLATKG